jgi:N-acetylglucosaminyldiphosphoundecaprenol N-acetyl-beta-D-mannosaminyltransferase
MMRSVSDCTTLPDRLRLGPLEVDRLTMASALDAIEGLVASGRGGLVVTPNVDHVIIAERNPEFRDAYAGAALSLADGMPILWAARLLGRPLPEKISGSDLMLPLAERAAARGWRVYLVGAGPGVAEEAARRLRSQLGVNVVGTESPRIRVDGQPDDSEAVLVRVRAAEPDLVLLALGAPKQEIWAHRFRSALGPAVVLGVGAGLDFVAGAVRRAPRWMSRVGLEWLFRLLREPRRLWRRYLVDDPRFAVVVWRAWREQRRQRIRPQGPE